MALTFYCNILCHNTFFPKESLENFLLPLKRGNIMYNRFDIMYLVVYFQLCYYHEMMSHLVYDHVLLHNDESFCCYVM